LTRSLIGRRAPVHQTALCAALLILNSSPAGAAGFWKPFLAGGLSGLAVHEASHLALDFAFDAEPRLKGVSFGPIPFFAITHRSDVTPGREALISGAGFFSQHVTSEIILSRRASEDALSNYEKGVLTFHVATSVAYAGAAFARYGPFERDTRGLADATGSDERLIGALVLAPAALDTWRYLRPDSRTAKWASRIAKVGFLGVIAFKR
jgi:hypothetical protein